MTSIDLKNGTLKIIIFDSQPAYRREVLIQSIAEILKAFAQTFEIGALYDKDIVHIYTLSHLLKSITEEEEMELRNFKSSIIDKEAKTLTITVKCDDPKQFKYNLTMLTMAVLRWSNSFETINMNTQSLYTFAQFMEAVEENRLNSYAAA